MNKAITARAIRMELKKEYILKVRKNILLITDFNYILPYI